MSRVSIGGRVKPLVLALGLISVYSAPLSAVAQAEPASANQEQYNFQIAPQSLNSALIHFASQSGMQLVYDGDKFAALDSAGLQGSYTLSAGLDRLLAGTSVSYTIKPNNFIELTFNAAPKGAQKPRRLQSVVVSAAGFEQEIVDAPASISVITSEDIEGKSYRDVTDALQDIPGVSVEGGAGSSKGGTAEISIRGMQSKYTLIMVDGKAQGSDQAYYNGYGNGAEFGWLPPLSAIERIEIIRGPMSSLYGSDALGGVVNIITKKVANEWGGSLTIDKVKQDDPDSGDADQYRYYLEGPLVEEKLGFALYGNLYNRQEDNIVNGYRQRRSESTNAKFSWNIGKDHSLVAETGYATQRSSGTADKSGELDFENERRYYALTHEIRWDKTKRTQSYIQNENMDNITQNAHYKRTTFNTTTNWLVSDSHLLTLGAQLREQKTENPARAKNKANLERVDGALFVEDEWSVSEKLTLTGGLRWVDDEKYGGQATPRLYGIYKLTDSWVFKSGVSTGYRTPDLKQGDSDWVEGGGGRNTDGADVGNDDLKPEESVNVEAAVMWNSESGSNASVTLYRTQFNNKIEKPIICQESEPLAYDCSYQGVAYQRVYQYQNVEDAELQGLEASLTVPMGAVETTFNYTYSHSEQKTGEYAGEPLNNYPEHYANVKTDWLATDNLRVWGRIKYKSSTAETGASEIPAYTFVDAGVSYEMNNSAQLYLGVYNLFDKEVTQEDYGKVLDGRQFNAGLTVSF